MTSRYEGLPLIEKQGEIGTMEETRFLIPTISCGHCVMTIQRELGEIEGVYKVEGDPGAKQIMVQ